VLLYLGESGVEVEVERCRYALGEKLTRDVLHLSMLEAVNLTNYFAPDDLSPASTSNSTSMMRYLASWR
jgi:hypothetical protein